MLKANPPENVQEKIRLMAAAAGVPVTQFLNPFIVEIAAGRIQMVPQVAQPKQAA